MLDLLIEDEDDVCTPAYTATGDKAVCAWCTKAIIAGKDKWHSHWMGWTHSTCDVGKLGDFKNVLHSLQQRYPTASMPEECHNWGTLKELREWAGIQASQGPADEIPIQAQLQRFTEAAGSIKTDPDATVVIKPDSDATVVIKPDPDATVVIKRDPDAASDGAMNDDRQATQVYTGVTSPATPPQVMRTLPTH